MIARKLLIDSCVAPAVARRLRSDGHDVLSVGEMGADPGDAGVLALAAAEGRAIVTIDSDFGALVFRDGAARVGVLRLRDNTPAALSERASALVAAHGGQLEQGAFVTDHRAYARVTPRKS